MEIAVLTRASAGLGKAFFEAYLQSGTKVDEIWLIARRKERLEALAATTDQKVRVLPLDLVNEDSIGTLRNLLETEKPQVKALINNAGFGKMGYVYDLSPEEQGAMVDLNCRALTALSALFTPYMQRGGYIVNVCSIASFVPNPRMTVYSSTKAYVMSFSRGLREEMKQKGVNVLALCPGPMSTEFLPIAGIGAGDSKTFDTLPYADPAKVAKAALKHAAKGHAVYTPKLLFKVYRILARIIPHRILMKVSKV
jgi:short-subunit dehydrogenase